ncbi:MFS transporter [Streptomyces sp. NPDC001393]
MTALVADRVARRRVLVLVGTIVVLDAMFFAALTPMLPYYADRFGLSESGSGILSGAYAAGTLAGALPSGWLGWKIGPRKTVVVALVVISLTSLVFAFGNDIVLLDAARFVQGLAGACSWSGAMAWLLSVTPVDERGRAIGAITALGFSGALLGPAFGAVARGVGPQAPFIGIAVLSALLVTRSRRPPEPRPPERARYSLAAALRDRTVRTGMGLMALPSFVCGGLNVLNPLRLDHLGAGGLTIGATFLIAAAVQAVGQVAIGSASDLIGRQVPLLVVLAAGAVLVALSPQPATIWVCATVVIAATACFGVMYTPALALLTDGAEAIGLERALALALVNATWAGGQTVGALTASAVAEATADAVTYELLAALSAASFGALLWWGRERTTGLGTDHGADSRQE